jgi:hypothetical protein
MADYAGDLGNIPNYGIDQLDRLCEVFAAMANEAMHERDDMSAGIRSEVKVR